MIKFFKQKSKYIAFVLCVFICVVALSACGNNVNFSLVDLKGKNIALNGKLDLADDCYSFEFERKENGDGTLIFTEPRYLSGIAVVKSQDGYFYKLNDLNLPLKNKQVKNIASSVFGVFCLDDTIVPSFSNENQLNVFTYAIDGGVVKFCFTENGDLKCVKSIFDGREAVLSITDFRIS